MENQANITAETSTDKPFFVSAETFNFDKHDFLFAVITGILSFLYIRIVFMNNTNGGYFIFALLFFAVFLGYYYSKTKTFPTQCIPYCLLSLASALPLFIYGSVGQYSSINVLFTMFFAVYAVAVATKIRLQENLGDYFFNDAANLFIFRPFKNFGCFFKALVSKRKGGEQVKTFLIAVASVILAIVVMLFAYGALAEVDQNFSKIMSKFFDAFSFSGTENLFAFFLGIPVSCYLFGIFCSSIHKKNHQKKDVEAISAKRSSRSPLPTLLPSLPMIALACVYILFFISHISTLAAAIPNGGILYSEYARQGFFELCQVTFLNLLICLSSMALCKRDNKLPAIILVLNCILSVCTILLMATAATKLVLYISIFGLTIKRIHAGWAMLVIFVVFVLVFVRQIKAFNFIKASVLFTCISFILLSTVGSANIALAYNYNLYKSEKMSVSDFLDTSDEAYTCAVPYVLEIYKTEADEKDRYLAAEYLYFRCSSADKYYFDGDILSDIGAFNVMTSVVKFTLSPYADELQQQYNEHNYYVPD